MGAVNMLRQAELRRHWGGIVALTLLVGLVGAVVLAGAAGARRSASALSRFQAESRSAAVEINVGDVTPKQLADFRRTRGVAAVAELRQLAMVPKGFDQIALAGAIDSRFGSVVDRPRVLRGRRANPAAPFEIEVGEDLAHRLRLSVGDRLAFRSYTPSDIQQVFATNRDVPPSGPPVDMRVVGIVRRPLDLGLRGALGGVLVPTPAFTRGFRDRIGTYSGSILRVRTDRGAVDVPHVVGAARRIFGGSDSFDVQSLGIETEGARNAIDVLTVAIWVFAAVVALAGVVAIAIVLGRQLAVVVPEQPTLRSLGLTRAQRALAAALPAAPAALGGATIAVLGAIGLSGRFPMGLARRAEPDPGLRFDGPVLVLGAVAIVLLVVVVAAVVATRVARSASVDVRRGRQPSTTTFTARVVARLGVAPAPAVGARMALEPGRGSTAVPVRSAIAGLAIAVVGVVALLTFASSLDHLRASPSLRGWSWDVAAYDQTFNARGPGTCGPVDSQVVHDRLLQDVASVCTVNLQLDNRSVKALGFRQLRGKIEPSIVAGRAPRTRNEVAVGTATLDALGKTIGSTVHVSGPNGPVPYRIVGTVAFPVFGDPQPLADGATFTGAGLGRVIAPGSDSTGQFFAGDFTPGVDPVAATKHLNALPGISVSRRAEVPVEIDRLAQIDGLPAILGGFLVLIAVVAVGHALVTAVRRRRRDLAIFKTLGFRQRQVRGAVAWQATTLAGVGALIGVPFGVIVGRLVWTMITDDLGVVPVVTVPVVTVALAVALTVLLANLVAALPARSAARTSPALVLRSE